MEIWHRVTINAPAESDLLKMIENLTLKKETLQLPGGGGLLVLIDIKESDSNWPVISNLISTANAADMKETYFNEEEIRNAEWLRLIPTFERGYPQPKSHWPLKQQSYEIICPQCAIYKQIAPMRLAKEPFLGKKSFMSLIWASEIFCVPEVFQNLKTIQAHGYQVWEALIHKSGIPSERVQQLYIPGIASRGIIFEDELIRKTCPACGITKYYPHLKGEMLLKREALIPDMDFLLSNEWFGHGLLAWREILVSNRIAKLVLDKGWSGIRFKVVKTV